MNTDSPIKPVNLNNLSHHVSKVYELVTQSLLFFCAGVTVGYMIDSSILYILSLFTTIIAGFIFVGSITDTMKYISMNVVASGLGVATAPSIAFAYQLDRSIVPTAAFSTMVIFAFFTYYSKSIKNESMELINGFLYSALLASTIVGVVMLFLPTSDFVQLAYLGLGLIMFCGFISYDTKLMYNRFREGNMDYYFHAMNLFLDIINVFVKTIRILTLLSKKENPKKKD
jgi:FtsH-binding integral membrane protein